MKRFLRFLAVGLTGLLFAWTVNFVVDHFRRPAEAVDLSCNTIHEPAGGCPAGYSRTDLASFTEPDGTRQSACYSSDASKASCVDFVRPQESFGVDIEIPLPPTAEPQPAKGPRT